MSALNPYRHSTTSSILAAVEVLRFDAAEIDADPAAWSYPAESRAFLMIHLDDAQAELRRRERLRYVPSAPPWPDPKAELETIKARIDLSSALAKWAALAFRQHGPQLWARCPFPDHEDTNPSFVVSPEKGLWHCWGCRRGGDVFSFALEWFGCASFADAVDLVAREAGVPRQKRRRAPTPPVYREVGVA